MLGPSRHATRLNTDYRVEIVHEGGSVRTYLAKEAWRGLCEVWVESEVERLGFRRPARARLRTDAARCAEDGGDGARGAGSGSARTQPC